MSSVGFVTESFQMLNSHAEWSTIFICLSHPELHMPPRDYRIGRDELRSVILLPCWAPSTWWSPVSSAHLRAFWRQMCSSHWGKQNLKFLIQQQLGSLGSHSYRILPLCREPAPSYSPGTALQHLGTICPFLLLWVLCMWNTASQEGYFQKHFEVFFPENDQVHLQLKWTTACL